MACGVEMKIRGGAVVRCDNAGASNHAGQHSGITTKFWYNFGYKVRVYWTSGVKTPVRQKPIIRGDYFAPLPEDALPSPGGLKTTYSYDFLSDTLSNFEVVTTPMRIVNGVAQPPAQPSRTDYTKYTVICTDSSGAAGNGRTQTDDQTMVAYLSTTDSRAATDMPTMLILRAGETWGVGTRADCFIYAGEAPRIYSLDGGSITLRATGTGSVPAGAEVEFSAIGNKYSLYVNNSGTPIVEWIDNTNVVNRGSANRRWGFGTTANYPRFQRQYDSSGISTIRCEDAA